MAILWPINLLPPRHLALDIAPRTLAGPASVNGVSQVVASDAGIWTIKYVEVPIHEANRILTWRAISNLLEGRLNPILVPISRAYQPLPVGVGDEAYEPVPHSDGTYFSDGTGYVGGTVEVTLAGSLSARSVSGNITISIAGVIQPGQHFSIGDRLYRLRSVDYTSETTAAITFRPPLRESAVNGAPLEFDEPVCRMKLASDNEMDLPLDYNRWSFPSINFIEDL